MLSFYIFFYGLSILIKKYYSIRILCTSVASIWNGNSSSLWITEFGINKAKQLSKPFFLWFSCLVPSSFFLFFSILIFCLSLKTFEYKNSQTHTKVECSEPPMYPSPSFSNYQHFFIIVVSTPTLTFLGRQRAELF